MNDILKVYPEAVSRTICHMLRHAPEQYGLQMDSSGWVDAEAVVSALRARRPECATMTIADLERLLDQVPMDHFELRDGRVRALYGHSVPVQLYWTISEPTGDMYHGTDQAAARLIAQEGLKKGSRQHAMLTPDPSYARYARSRKSGKPYLIRVDAKRAHGYGIAFYRAVDLVWLADFVPPEFLAVMRPGRKHTQRRLAESRRGTVP